MVRVAYIESFPVSYTNYLKLNKVISTLKANHILHLKRELLFGTAIFVEKDYEEKAILALKDINIYK